MQTVLYNGFLKWLKNNHGFDNTLFVFTADHIGAIIDPINYQRETMFFEYLFYFMRQQIAI